MTMTIMSDSIESRTLSRTDFVKLTGGGLLFATLGASGMAASAKAQVAVGPWPDTDPRRLDTWIAVHPDNTVTAFYGKNDLGQGLETAFQQIVAEEMDLAFKQVKSVVSDTARTPHQGGASGSTGITNGGTAVRNMAAEARRVLVELASARLGVPVSQLTVREGVVSGGGKTITYGQLLGGQLFNTTVSSNMSFGNGLTAVGQARPKNPADHHIVGSPVPRIDIPPKVFGQYTFNVDVRLPGMLHARMVRPPDAGSTIARIRGFKQKVPGVVRVLPIGDRYVAVVAEREEQAIAASRALEVEWTRPASPPFPSTGSQFDFIRKAPPRASATTVNRGNVDSALSGASKVLQAEYLWPIQGHTGMGPVSATAHYDPQANTITIWSGTQKSHQVRDGVSELLGMPKDRVRTIWNMGPGSYGRGDADDGALEAAWISRQLGRPVRLQWMRHEGTAWDPKAPAAVVNLRGAVDASGKIVARDYHWKGTSGVQSSGERAGDTLVGMANGFIRPPTNPAGSPADRYVIANDRVVRETIEVFLPPTLLDPLRAANFRDPQGPQAAWASEQFMDELAYAAGMDPIQFRLNHLDPDSQDADVLRAVAAKAKWEPRRAASRIDRSAPVLKGRGIAYQFRGAHIGAIVTELEVTRKTGKIQLKRVFMAADVGEVINPDGLLNTMEGNYVMAASRTLKEETRFTRRAVTSTDWVTYPILNAMEVPDSIEFVAVNNAPGNPPGPAGEGMTRVAPPSIANAFFDATGVRLRQAPMTPARVRGVLRQAGL